MAARRLSSILIVLAALTPHGAVALDWSIERSFRCFLYPSDLAAQQVAYDLLQHEGRAPTPEALEALMNGRGFWTTKLGAAGDLRKRWPIEWPRDDDATPWQLVRKLRIEEGRPAPVSAAELERRGWASLLVRERPDRPTETGSTDTCWNPVHRLHDGCAVWGDYVRPPGWIVRVFDPDAPAGQSCQWTFAGAVPAAGVTPARFAGAVQRALAAGETTVSADCREIRIVAPSNPADAKTVAGRVSVTRRAPDGSQAAVLVTPQDRLVIGFGDSFTSGEGNPEGVAQFTGKSWPNGALPPRADDPTSLSGTDSRAQWTDRWCHRSVYSWQIRTALAAALADPRQSFTILPYGCSGATIPEGILYGYNGVEPGDTNDRRIRGSRSEIGLAYQEICQPAAFRSYCASGAPWCGRTDPPSAARESAAGFYEAAAPALRRAVARCGSVNVFKRSADALLIDIGINDVGFAGWAAGIILHDPVSRAAAHAMTPCFDASVQCADTRRLFAQLENRYGLLRKVLDDDMLPDFGIDPSHVIVAVYPPALENERGAFCPLGNAGLTVATFSPFPFANACSGGAAPIAHGALAEYPASDQVERQVEQARVKLNASLAAFALKAGAAFDVVNAYTSNFARRGVCATTDPLSHPPADHACFTTNDLFRLPCAPNPESMHVSRAGPSSAACPGDPAAFTPFPPSRFEPYQSRTRLYRTMNDVFLAINKRPAQYIDQTPFGVLDLADRATGGAFHPTAEGHALIANDTAEEFCRLVGCGP